MGPKYLAFYEWEGPYCLTTLGNPATMIPEAKGLPLARNVSWNVYKPIARHVAFR